MSDPRKSGWSSRKKFTVGGTLGALASVATIVTFLHGASPSQPQPGPGPGPVADTTSLASLEASYLNECESGVSTPAFCNCTLNWLVANVPSQQLASELALFPQYVQQQTSEPPQDVVNAFVACTTNGS